MKEIIVGIYSIHSELINIDTNEMWFSMSTIILKSNYVCNCDRIRDKRNLDKRYTTSFFSVSFAITDLQNFNEISSTNNLDYLFESTNPTSRIFLSSSFFAQKNKIVIYVSPNLLRNI